MKEGLSPLRFPPWLECSERLKGDICIGCRNDITTATIEDEVRNLCGFHSMLIARFSKAETRKTKFK